LGGLTLRRRRLTARGVPPVGQLPPGCAWFSVEGAGAPTPGARVVLALPSLKADRCPRVVDAVAQAFPDRLKVLLLDHRGAHPAQRRTLPANVRLVCLPPYGPELNPMARGWRDLQDDLAWQQSPTLEAHQDAGGDVLPAYEALTLHSLTGSAYLVDAIKALPP
jgi:hypothetical protein